MAENLRALLTEQSEGVVENKGRPRKKQTENKAKRRRRTGNRGLKTETDDREFALALLAGCGKKAPEPVILSEAKDLSFVFPTS